MSSAIYDFTIDQYATLQESFTVVDPNQNDAPVDLSVGFSAQMQIRDGANLVVTDLSNTNGGIVLGVGLIEIIMSAAATGALSFTTAKYDLLITETATGNVYRYLQGKVKISTGITHA